MGQANVKSASEIGRVNEPLRITQLPFSAQQLAAGN
jgi:hypothetical protein